MFKKKLPQWSMLPAEVEVTHFTVLYRMSTGIHTVTGPPGYIG
jgi:hypothetical protein